VPAWAWLNRLAHGFAAEVRALAAEGASLDDHWDGAIRFLAGELVARAPDDRSMATLQRDALVPLELAMAARRGRGRDAGAARVPGYR